ncbi:hypothetical protein EYR41_007585 [Orbilia oligospora]|uniref:Uncharacterized protein n=1 Tax=Orbilia oligospora TaxID=2813651 RepID=A0A8H2DWW4_ORBOL|nr:hypothetical protein TWF132_011598 [Orbilia oligospora]TGJ68540.1 hypothetical protein EYR41_007585 [Orbilia oligospora]
MSQVSKLNPLARIFKPGASGFDTTPISTPEVAPKENIPPPAPGLLPKKARERVSKPSISELDQVITIPAPKESPEIISVKVKGVVSVKALETASVNITEIASMKIVETTSTKAQEAAPIKVPKTAPIKVPETAPIKVPEIASIKVPETIPTKLPPSQEAKVRKDILFFGDIQAKMENFSLIEPGKHYNTPVAVPAADGKILDPAQTLEYLRQEALKRAQAELDTIKVLATIPAKPIRTVRSKTPNPKTSMFWKFLDKVEDLATRALAKGFRQPLNAMYNPHRHDPWHHGERVNQYYYNDGLIAASDINDPVQVLTDNAGAIRYELWNRMWLQIRNDYLHESFLPDPRAVALHRNMTKKLIPTLQREVGAIIEERSREKVYTEQQVLSLDRGVKERTYWLEHLEKCLDYVKVFERLLEEFPDNTMMAKDWFDKQFFKGKKDIGGEGKIF